MSKTISTSEKNYPASLFSFCQCQHGDHLGVPVLKATHGESLGGHSGSRCCCWFFFSLEPNGWWGWRSMYSETQTKANKVSKVAQLADFSAAQQQYLFCYEYKNSFKRSRVVSITIRFSAKHLDVHCSSSPPISIFNKQIQTISSAALQLFSSSIWSIHLLISSAASFWRLLLLFDFFNYHLNFSLFTSNCLWTI